MNDNLDNLDANGIMMAKHYMEQSSATKRKVGAFISSHKRKANFAYFGLNYLPKNLFNCELPNGNTKSYVIHAEEAAIISFLNQKPKNLLPEDYTIYCTYSPCYNCCKLIVQSGIKRLIYLEEHKTNFTTSTHKDELSPKEFLEECGVEVIQYQEQEKPHYLGKEYYYALVYHKSNVDGLMGAYLLNRFAKHCRIPNYDLIPYTYGEEHDYLTNEKYTNYIFVDITPPKDWLKSKLIDRKVIEIYDHHKKHYDDILLECSPDKFNNLLFRYYFNENKCGSKIFFQERKFKLDFSENEIKIFENNILELVDLYDTWKFTKSKHIGLQEKVLAFNQYFIDEPCALNFKEFKDIIDFMIFDFDADLSENEYDKIIDIGLEYITKIKEDNKKRLEKALSNVNQTFVLVEGYPNYWLQEEVGNSILITFKIDMAKQIIKFSVRTKEKSEISASIIASNFGGGGHKHAAGFKLSLLKGFNMLQNPEYTINAIIQSK